ncbi:MAG: mechanosensitive ion channel family protein [Calothrix sp. MO_167.B42]|nr:mechanosensitive ion channel family protein [Calothrix sp. MO_167.B42]
MTHLTINIITIIAELAINFIFFFLVNWCFNKLYRQVFKIPLLKQFNNNASVIRRNFRIFIFLCCFTISLAIIGINGYLAYRGENVRDYSLSLLSQIPSEFWTALGLGFLKCIGAIIATSIALKIFNPLLDKTSIYLQNIDLITDNDRSIAIFFDALKKNINNASWIGVSILCAQFIILPPIVSKYLYVLLRIYLIVAIGRLVFKVVAVIIDSLDALSVKNSNSDNVLRFYVQLRHLIPLFKRCLELIIYVLMTILVVQQIDFIANLGSWGLIVIKIILMFLMSQVIISIAYLIVEELLLKSPNLTEIQQQRRHTITPLIKSFIKYSVYFGVGIFILETIGINPQPILAGAGILGLAVGIGAQNLINDIVSGFFILFENYYLVGDYIETDKASGYVEAIELRTTRIRHHLGQVFIIRNGNINSITNFSKDYIYSYVEVGVDYDSNINRVQEIIETVGNQLKQENSDVLEPTQVDGVKEFGDIRLSIFTMTKVKPGRHVQVKRKLRKMLKEAFDHEGIYIPIGETTDKPDWLTQGSSRNDNRAAK